MLAFNYVGFFQLEHGKNIKYVILMEHIIVLYFKNMIRI